MALKRPMPFYKIWHLPAVVQGLGPGTINRRGEPCVRPIYSRTPGEHKVRPYQGNNFEPLEIHRRNSQKIRLRMTLMRMQVPRGK